VENNESDERSLIGMAVNDRCSLQRSKELLACLEEWLEDGIWRTEVIVDYIDEITCVHQLGDDLSGSSFRVIESGPLLTEFKGLILLEKKIDIL